MSTKEQVGAFIRITKTIADCIRDAGSIPSGHLYAAICSKIDLDQYQSIIGILKRSGLITESHHELKWIGPKQ